MKEVLHTFKIFPSVVPANEESEIYISAGGGYMLFYDDISYDVEFIPTDESDIGEDDSLTIFGLDKKRKSYSVKPHNGILKLKYFFRGEQQWNIHISTKEYEKHEIEAQKKAAPHWDWVRERPSKGVTLSIYSLEKDLYERRPLRGDLHVHTNMSDGDQSPSLTCAEYRRAGYDFIAITDHAQYDIAKYTRADFDLKTDFKILTAEEIHNSYDGQLHIICIGANAAISDILMNEKDKIETELEELKSTVQIPDGVAQKEYLLRLWVYKKAKDYGGLVIYPHPYWYIGKKRWHVGPKLAMAILKDGLCDAFEIMGGGNASENNLQSSLYYEAAANGIKLPIVSSSDNHSIVGNFDVASTYIFAKNDDIKEAIYSGYCVAAEHQAGETQRFYGPYRLVRYTKFLAENYFPLHTRLCQSAAQVLIDYIDGDIELKEMVEKLEQRVQNFEKKFFGRI